MRPLAGNRGSVGEEDKAGRREGGGEPSPRKPTKHASLHLWWRKHKGKIVMEQTQIAVEQTQRGNCQTYMRYMLKDTFRYGKVQQLVQHIQV
jgi:hypothetical protein